MSWRDLQRARGLWRSDHGDNRDSYRGFDETSPALGLRRELGTNAAQLVTVQGVLEAEPAPASAPKRSRLAETSDVYPAVVVYLNDRMRVIECRHGLQWIVQRRRSVCPNSWRGMKYCRTKEVLMSCVGTADEAAMEILRALPDRFPERPSRREQSRRGPKER